jgi:CO dehydrogenase/acetyl-CoA synthase beta subunit
VPLQHCVSMACVLLPFRPAEGVDLFSLVWERFHIVVPIMGVPGADGVWVRISAQVYNEMSDYETLAQAILTLQREQQTEL